MKLSITHATEYRYDAPVRYGLQRLRLRPRDAAGQSVTAWQTRVEGGAVESSYTDHFGNRVELVSFHADGTVIRIVASGEVETWDVNGVYGHHKNFAPLWLFQRETPLTRPGRLTREVARSARGDDAIGRLHALMLAIGEAVAYEHGITHSATSAEEALEHGSGVCQDHAHVFIAAARVLGYPARYISGYLRMEDREDQAASHAWAEAYVEGLGWVGFDPANGISPDARYVRVATGLDYRDAAPVSGIRLGQAAETLAVSLSVEQ